MFTQRLEFTGGPLWHSQNQVGQSSLVEHAGAELDDEPPAAPPPFDAGRPPAWPPAEPPVPTPTPVPKQLPATQACVEPQLLHDAPPRPQAPSDVPETQAPLDVQQPLHVLTSQTGGTPQATNSTEPSINAR